MTKEELLDEVYDLIDDKILHNIYLHQEGKLSFSELKDVLEQYTPAIFDKLQTIYSED